MAPTTDDPFFSGLRRQTVRTSAGPCELPILYSDASLLGLLYRVDAERARELVDPTFEPWVIFGKALAMIALFEYRETTIGPYGEIGVGVLVKRRGSSPSLARALVDLRKERDAGLYVINLPVTTEAARSAGRELWGYPKYVAPIDTRFRPDSIRIGLGKELEVAMDLRATRSVQTRGLPFVLYSVNAGGRILRTVVDVDHRVQWGGAGRVSLKVTGEGPTATTVKALGLDRAPPALAFRTDGMRSILPAGVDMGATDVPRKRDSETLRTGHAPPDHAAAAIANGSVRS
jgi:hypothetical protein